MADLLERLKEALDETERIAREASGPKGIWPSWETSKFYGYETPHVLIGIGSDRQPLSGGQFTYTPVEKRFADHIVRNDPARVLRQVAAHRKLIDVILTYEAKIDSEWGCCHSAEDIGRGKCPDTKPEDIPGLLALAEIYDVTVEEPAS